MTVFLPVANVINLIIEHWQISVVAVAVFASLCLGVFKGAKHGVRAMGITLALSIAFVCARLTYYFIDNDLDGLIKFAIAWLPTIVFLIAVVLSTLIGIHRGLRKSLILLLHAIITGGLCLGVYFFCVNSAAVDKLLLDFVNVFMGAGGLQNQLGVSQECETIREVFLEYASTYVADWGEFGILINANSAYVLTLVNMAYRVAFAIVFFIVYQLLLFIAYLIYLAFYPERRYRKKKNINFAINNADCSYKKRPVGGGCVGLARGLVSGIIFLSFIGSVFFIAVGGAGANRLSEDISFGEDYDPYVSIYRSIEEYGDQGIFKILNAVSDPKDTPYYLFAADIVFSGGLDDDLHDVSGNVKFREELSAYVGFAKNTLALLLKHDNNGEIASILSGQTTEDKMSKILDVCLNPEFQVEFDNLIERFDSQTYVINFALSLADAVIANADDMSFMNSVSADNKELLQVMFTRGYLSETIPDERELKYGKKADSGEIPPYITINHLFTKKDAQTVLDVVLSIIAGEVNVKEPASIAKVLIPYIENLSVFSTNRSKEMDPVLGRLYCYFDNKYLTDEDEDGIRYSEIKTESVSWTKEIRALLSVSDGLYTMYDKVYGSENSIFTEVVELFDEENGEYEENVRMYEELTDVVSDSVLLSKALCSKKISRFLEEQFKKISDNIYFPAKITYENKYDGEGNIISYGEAYQLLRGLRLLADKENKDILDSLLSVSEDTIEDFMKRLSETISKDDPYAKGNSLASYLTESVLFRSALSSVVTERAGDMLVVPKYSFEKDADGNTVNLINKYELREIFDALPKVIDKILPLASEEITATHIKDILDDETFNLLLDNGNKIVEGTISNALITVFSDNGEVVLPRRLENYEEWITVDGTEGELRKFIRNTVEILELDVGELMDGGLDKDSIFDKMKTLKDSEVDGLFESGVYHYTVSDMMDNGGFSFGSFKVVVPSSAYRTLIDDNLVRVIKAKELSSVFIELNSFGLTSDMSNENIIRKLVEQKEVLNRSNIISASIVNFIVENENICSTLNVPQSYIDAGSRLDDYDSTNAWYKELPNMIEAIDEIFEISQMAEDEEFVFNSDTISEKTNKLLKELNDPSVTNPDLTRLEVCYASDVLKNNITVELDKALDGVVKEEVIESAKINGYYAEEELRALSETASIFDLDILNIDNGELAKKVKDQILSLNKPHDGDAQNRSTLDIMYPSAIIRYFVTDEIDKALNGTDQDDYSLIDIPVRDGFKQNKVYPKTEISALVDALEALGVTNIDDGISSDNFTVLSKYRDSIDVICNSGIVNGIITKQIDGALSEDLIDVYVKEQIKGSSRVYSKAEISNLVDALDELGLKDFNEFVSIEIDDIKGESKTESGVSKLDVIYRSDLVAGAVTKKVKDTFDENAELIYHNSANRTDLPVLKKQEVNALLNLLGDVDLDNFDVGKVSLTSVREQLVPDADGNPQSYLISANFTDTLLNKDQLYVPSNACYFDGYGSYLISAEEQLRFIDALIALRGDTPLDEWEVENDMVLPDRGSRELLLVSKIMSATFSHHVFTDNVKVQMIFSQTSVDVSASRMTASGEEFKLPVINTEQLNALFELVEGLGGTKLEIPDFSTFEDIQASADIIDLLCAFDVTRFKMSIVILEKFSDVKDQLADYIEIVDCNNFSVAYGDRIVWTPLSAEALTEQGIVKLVRGQ